MNMTNSLNSLISYILYGDFGLLTTVPYFLFKILFPIITSFYLLQLFLTQSNLLDVVSSPLDRCLSKLGLSVNTMLSLILGLGCVTVALGTLQTESDSRQRRIAQILLCMIIPCSAQLVINTALIFQMDVRYLIWYLILVISAFFIFSIILTHLFSSNCIKGCSRKKGKYNRRAKFTMPPIFPLVSSAFMSSIRFLGETALPFAIGNIIVSVLYFFGYVQRLCALTSPIICDFLKLPSDAAAIFVLTIIKKDLAASSLLSLFAEGKFSEPQMFVTIVMLTFFVPCFASMVVFFKYEKKYICITVWLLCVALSLAIGKILSCLLILP